ncbi:MAG: hypothetical protein QM689_12370 [Oscillospiraceae bacterium]
MLCTDHISPAFERNPDKLVYTAVKFANNRSIHTADNLDQSKVVATFKDAYAHQIFPDDYKDDGYKSIYEE